MNIGEVAAIIGL